MIEDVQDSETQPPPTYQPTTISHSDRGWPDLQNIRLFGHGQLPNLLLGKSRNSDFALGAGFKGWTSGPEFARHLVDYQINLNFNPDAPTASTSTPVPSSSTPQKQLSYSQAAALPSQAAQAGAGASSNAVPKKPMFQVADLALARPHPHAYFNVRSFSWTVIAPLPDHTSQSKGSNVGCPGMSSPFPHLSTVPQAAHFYVRIDNAVDPKFLLRTSHAGIESHFTEDSYKLGYPSSTAFPQPDDPNDPCWHLSESSPTDRCWHVHVCTNCRSAFTVSPQDYIASVLDRELCQRFVSARRAEAAEGKDEAVRDAIGYMWKQVHTCHTAANLTDRLNRVLRNVLLRNELSPIPSKGSTFLKRMGNSREA